MNKATQPIPPKASQLTWPQTKKLALALAIAGFSAGHIQAQEAASASAEDDAGLIEIEEEVVVVGRMRSSLISAQDVKRNAGTVVDAISAKDLGSFPDKSVAEALQRVAGITVNRFAASADTAHFSAEPSGVIVRGLPQVRNEFNGRDSFSANSSRGLSWGDISPELLVGVDTYKNQTAELIEGGIAGTVNMRTRRPFDQEGLFGGITLSANYGDLSEEVTPEGSAIFSNRWKTSGGEVGFLINYAHSEVATRSQGNQLSRVNRFNGSNGGDFIASFDSNLDGNIDENDPMVFVPGRVTFRDNLYERTRDGLSLAVQYQDDDGDLVLTAQYNGTQYENNWEEHVVSVAPADASFGQSIFHVVPNGDGTPRPAVGTDDFTFDNDGLFQTGTVNTGMGWWGGSPEESASIGQNSAGEPFVTPCYGWNGCEPVQRGVDLLTETRYASQTNRTQDLSFNVQWAISDNVRSQFDVQYVDASVDVFDLTMGYASATNAVIDLSGDLPYVDMLAPTNVNLLEATEGQGDIYSNPNSYYPQFILDHLEESEGNQLSLRADFEFDVEFGHVNEIKVGTRYANRDQTVRWAEFNWQSIANAWTGNQSHYFNVDSFEPSGSFTGYPSDFYAVREFGDDYLNVGVNEFVFPNIDFVSNYNRMTNEMAAANLGAGAWNPICSNLGERSNEIPGTCFRPQELVEVQETTMAAYIQLELGGFDEELFGVPYSGNIGIRVVATELDSAGGASYAAAQDQNVFNCSDRVDNETGNPAPVPRTLGCYLTDDDLAFVSGGSLVESVSASHTNILPSLNLKFDISENLVSRFAVSRAMSRPDIGNLRNYATYSVVLPDQDDPNDVNWIKNDDGEIIGANAGAVGSGQNAFLKPITADQVDGTLEYYFSDTNSLTFTAFYKQFNDYIQLTTLVEPTTINGVTRDVEVQRPVNGDGAEIKGAEVSFQSFFDSLPEPFDGLGMQVNYTYVENSGVVNTNLTSTEVNSQAGDEFQTGDGVNVTVDRLEGLSDHTANFILMYEKNSVQARLAYSWRSSHLVTAVDCCTIYPIHSDDQSTLDGSIQYDINENFFITLAGTNLLNQEILLEQQVENAEDGGKRVFASKFQNDRRFTLSASYRF